jgi:hypothetical protein
MSRQRDQREARALTYLSKGMTATPDQIGRAAVQGEPREQRLPKRALEAIGLSIAVALTRRCLVVATRENKFRAAP